MGRDLTTNLKKSTNIAIVANFKLGLESLCASVSLSEIIAKFIGVEGHYALSIYYLDVYPAGCEELTKKVKIYNKIGEKTLYIKFPVKSVEKVTYRLIENDTYFELGLVDFKGKKPVNKTLSIWEDRERIEMLVGVGFENEAELEKLVPYSKKIINKFLFNKSNLRGDNLVSGVMELFLREGVTPTNIAGLASSIYYSSVA